MHQSQWCLRCLGICLIVLLTGCGAFFGTPDWKALYEQKLGESLTDIHETSLNEKFVDGEGYETRVSWASLSNGDTIFLGLPPRDNSPDTVVDQTVVLHVDEALDTCQTAIGQEFTMWGWGGPTDVVRNYVDIHVSTRTGVESKFIPDPNEPTCRFTFRRGGWHLDIMYTKGNVPT
ncbi:MAG: hypothetical protein AAGF95_16080 [Chloroflexota bacterium]